MITSLQRARSVADACCCYCSFVDLQMTLAGFVDVRDVSRRAYMSLRLVEGAATRSGPWRRRRPARTAGRASADRRGPPGTRARCAATGRNGRCARGRSRQTAASAWPATARSTSSTAASSGDTASPSNVASIAASSRAIAARREHARDQHAIEAGRALAVAALQREARAVRAWSASSSVALPQPILGEVVRRRSRSTVRLAELARELDDVRRSSSVRSTSPLRRPQPRAVRVRGAEVKRDRPARSHSAISVGEHAARPRRARRARPARARAAGAAIDRGVVAVLRASRRERPRATAARGGREVALRETARDRSASASSSASRALGAPSRRARARERRRRAARSRRPSRARSRCSSSAPRARARRRRARRRSRAPPRDRRAHRAMRCTR